LLFNFTLGYAIRKVQCNQVRLKLSGTCQLLAYADDVNLTGDIIDAVKKNTEFVIDSGREVGLQMNVEKTKYMLLACHHNASEIPDIKIVIRSFQNVSLFKYLGTTIRN
jgi:hypothetical protein